MAQAETAVPALPWPIEDRRCETCGSVGQWIAYVWRCHNGHDERIASRAGESTDGEGTNDGR